MSGKRGQEEDLGAPSQEANRCSPSGVSQMADIKESRGVKKDENTPEDEQNALLHVSHHVLTVSSLLCSFL